MRITAGTRTPGAAPDFGPSALAAALNREWRYRYELRRTPAPPAWASDPDLAGYRCVVEALAELEAPGTPACRREELLVALTRAAANADAEAARVVVQFLLPCLVAAVRSRPDRPDRSRAETLDDLVSAAWEAVATGVERRGRPMKVALLRRIEHQALCRPGRAARRHAAREVFADPVMSGAFCADLSGRAPDADLSAEEEVVALLAEGARAGLDPADLRLLASLTFGAGLSARAAADGVSARWIRYRRAAAVRRLAELAA